MQQAQLKPCDYDGRTIRFFESQGSLRPDGRWLISCPELTYGEKIVFGPSTVLGVIRHALSDIALSAPKENAALVQIRPHQAVGLFLEQFISATHLKRAVIHDDHVDVGPVYIDGYTLTFRVIRVLPHGKSVIITDKNGKVLN